MKKFIATYVETSDTCDGRPRVLGVYDTYADAKRDVVCDMQEWHETVQYSEDVEHGVDFSKMSVRVGECECVWNIEEIEI